MDIGQQFIDRSREYLTREYTPRILECMAALDDAAIWARPDERSNSLGNLILHLCGNVRQYIVSGVGGARDVRTRQAEFDQRDPIPREELVERLRQTIADADAVLATVTPAQLLEPRHVQGKDTTVFRAIYQVVEHFSMHTGQIIMMAKAFRPGAIRFYDVVDGVATPRWNRG